MQNKINNMTPELKKCLNFINKFINEFGYSPIYDEIKDGLGLKTRSGVHKMIVSLEKAGYIKRTPKLARTIEIIPHADWRDVSELIKNLIASMKNEKTDNNGDGTVEVDAKIFWDLDLAFFENSELSLERPTQETECPDCKWRTHTKGFQPCIDCDDRSEFKAEMSDNRTKEES